MRTRILFFILIVIIVSSCSQRFPEPVTSPVESEIVNLKDSLFSGFETGDDTQTMESGNEIYPENLESIQDGYITKDERFDLRAFEEGWQNFRNEMGSGTGGKEATQKWFEITGLLFQLTGNAVYAEELERIAFTNFFGTANENELEKMIEPYVFTRSVDHIHVNLFTPAEISYNHSLGGDVGITQETDYPRSGSIKLHFSMETKRYIEIFVRIPSWADDASVEVKGVKYFAVPGNYCKVAKKWKEDDVVEIEFSVTGKPQYLR